MYYEESNPSDRVGGERPVLLVLRTLQHIPVQHIEQT
jgi:hypothetical protein